MSNDIWFPLTLVGMVLIALMGEGCIRIYKNWQDHKKER